MKTNRKTKTWLPSVVVAAVWAVAGNRAIAHCDTVDGPIVAAARDALAQTNVNLVLIWVQPSDETGIKKAFEKTLAVRKLNLEARDLADLYFFETLVRVHRAGEGAPYTGLRPAGTDLGPAIPAADKAIQDGKIEPVATLLTSAVTTELHKRFKEVQTRKNYPKNDVTAGREYVKAYVEFVHYVESSYGAAAGKAGEHPQEEAKPATHEHK